METTKIELNKEEAELFLQFQKHHETFKVLLDADVFDTCNGYANLNFNSAGILTEIRTNVTIYRR